MDVFYIGQNDTYPDFTRTLKDAAGDAIDLTSASVEFRMGSIGQSATVSGACTIDDAANGIVTYAWQAGDTATAGTFPAKFVITFPSTQIGTVPNNGSVKVIIDPEILS